MQVDPPTAVGTIRAARNPNLVGAINTSVPTYLPIYLPRYFLEPRPCSTSAECTAAVKNLHVETRSTDEP